jgi:SAM-dependent methyltransferase
MQLPSQLRCPVHQAAFCRTGALAHDQDGMLRAACGCTFPVRRGIPRFVWDETYADAFGLQWNGYRKTQLDSHTGVPISKDRLARCVGGRLEDLRSASVLEVGCGAGRFTEVLLKAGARVFAVDLSSAVEANYANCSRAHGYFVCQADVLSLPVADGSFDAVIALGMIQHTPSPEQTIEALANSVRPGGLVVVDHYLPLPRLKRLLRAVTPRGILRQVLIRLPPRTSLRATDTLVHALLPIHRMLWRHGPVADRVRALWLRLSPVFDYYESHPELGEHLAEWALLDTHDALTDHYKHGRTPSELADALRAAGLEVIDSAADGNGAEARARRPAADASPPGAFDGH